MTTPLERAEKIERMFPPALPDVLRKEFIEKVAAQISEAEREAFQNGRLDAQYDTDTLPEQIEAYKRLAYELGWNAAQSENKNAISDAYASGFSEAKEKAKGIFHRTFFDRGPTHHDENHEDYCAECRFCLNCGEKDFLDRISRTQPDNRPICTAVECYCGKHFQYKQP